jgi:curli biogenesis system outer membrane secretion channel CsgG
LKKLSIISSLIASFLFIGCGGSNLNLDISNYSNRIRQPIMIPNVCKNEYKSLKSTPRVAVVRFTNNSSFSKAHISNKTKNSSFGIGIGDSADLLGLGAKANRNSYTTSRVVDPKLDKAITSVLEGTLVKIGGVEIYSREDLEKVIKEQKLEQSGLFDEKTLAKVGQLTGVKYIVTGSIDAVTQDYKDYKGVANLTGSAIATSGKKHTFAKKMIGAAVAFAGSLASGDKITTRATVKIIDITTGQIVFSRQFEESKNIGTVNKPTYTEIIGAIKDDLIEGLKTLKSELSKFFAPSGYILQVRSDSDHKNFIAQINLGTNQGVKAGQIFRVYRFDEITDPITNKTTCDKYAMNVKLLVSKNQIESNRAWTKAEGADALKLRAGEIVKRDALKIKNSLF